MSLRIPEASPRSRLLLGLEQAVAETGFAQATVAAVVRNARVSRRTFYEYFPDLGSCLLSSYVESHERILDAMRAALRPGEPWRANVRAATRAYLVGLQAHPALARTFLLEIQAAGPEAAKTRRAMHRQFEGLLRRAAEAMRRESDEVRELTPVTAAAVVGAINALVLLAAERGRVATMSELEETAADVVCRLLRAEPS